MDLIKDKELVSEGKGRSRRNTEPSKVRLEQLEASSFDQIFPPAEFGSVQESPPRHDESKVASNRQEASSTFSTWSQDVIVANLTSRFCLGRCRKWPKLPRSRSRVYRAQYAVFEERMIKSVRIYLLFLTSMNVITNSLASFDYPESPLAFSVLQTLYWLIFLAIICPIFFLRQSYRGQVKAVDPVLVMTSFRNIVPILMLDGDPNGYMTSGHGRFTIVSQVIGCQYCLVMINSLFIPAKWVYIGLLTVTYQVGLARSLYTEEELDDPSTVYFLGFFCLSLFAFRSIFHCYSSLVSNEVFGSIVKNAEQKKELSVILDNLAEAIVIFQSGEIIYHNARFSEHFPRCTATYQAFTLYGSEVSTTSSLSNLVAQPSQDLEANTYTAHRDEEGAEDLYLKFKKKEYTVEGETKTLLQLIDISKDILYDRAKAQAEFLTLINVTISHEMRNPLNSILNQTLSSLALLEKEQAQGSVDEERVDAAPGTEQQQQFKKQLLNSSRLTLASAKQLLFFVSDIIDFSRIQSGAFKKESEQFNVQEAIEEVVAIQEKQAESSSIRVKVLNRIKNLVTADKKRLQQVIYNLLSNALKFSKPGTSIQITSTAFSRENSLFIEVIVQDQGIGMSSDKQASLFQLFGSLQTSSQQNSSGIGFGLAACKSIVEAFDGEIKVDSKEGTGSQFKFTMKIEKADSADVVEEEDMALEPPLAQHGSCELSEQAEFKFEPKVFAEKTPFPRILVVDDQVFNTEALKVMLSILGVDIDRQVHSAANGLEAVEQAKAQTIGYHLIFMDQNMPFMDGYQATKEIKAHARDEGRPSPLVYAVTGHSEEAYIQIALSSGMERVLPKPVAPPQIKQALEDARSLFSESKTRVETMSVVSDEGIPHLDSSRAYNLISMNY